MSIFSAKYRPLARESFSCVFRTVMMKPCDTGMDERIKTEVVSGVLKYSPGAARIINHHFVALTWVIVVLSVASFAYSTVSVYNFYLYGNCDGPQSVEACIINDITGDYGRFSEPKQLVAPTEFDGIVAGNPDANVTIVEFGCFTCPYTAQAEWTMMQVLEEYNDSVYYVFKPFPVPNHPNSKETARAVLCAYRQEKHWELQKLIFSQQHACTDEGTIALKDLAAQAGLDMDEFNRCYENLETQEELEGYISQGMEANIYATPTFFINGKALVGPKPIEEFRELIEEAGSQ